MSTASRRPFFDLLPWLLVVFIPAVAMKSLAEERRGRTLEWLIAQPLTESEIVLGKFLGSWLFVMITLAGTLPMAVGVLLVSEADPGIMVAQYVGAALLTAQMIAIGIWASSITRNQITAFIIGAITCFVLVLIGTPVVQIGLPRLVGGWAAQLLGDQPLRECRPGRGGPPRPALFRVHVRPLRASCGGRAGR